VPPPTPGGRDVTRTGRCPRAHRQRGSVRSNVVERSGKADYAMSYVWRFKARKGQKVEISLASDGGRVKFCLTIQS